MPRRGTPTEIPGIAREGTKWILRATVRGTDGRRIEKQKMIEGASDKPKRAEMKALEDELERMKTGLRDEMNAQLVHGASLKETVGDFAPRWLEHTATTGKTRKHVVEKRLHHLEHFILPFLGDKALRALRRSDVAAWMQSAALLRQENGKLYGRVTLMGAWSTLRAMLRRAVILRDLEHDPTSGIVFDIGEHVAGEIRPAKRPKDALTLDEVGRLIDAAASESLDVRAMIVVQVATGMRFCEVSALEWRDIDLGRATLTIERSQVHGTVGPPKTESTRRRVYLPEAVVEVLRSHKAAQELERVATSIPGLVFPSKSGTYRMPAMLTKPLDRCCKNAGIDKRLSSHGLRRTANDLLRRANSDVVVRAMIGHATSEMTQLYSNVDHDERARAHAAAYGNVLDRAVDGRSRIGGTVVGSGVGPTEN